MKNSKENLLKQKESVDKQWDNIMRMVENGIVPDKALVVMVMDMSNAIDKKIIEEKYKEPE